LSNNVIPLATNRAVYTVPEVAQLLSLSKGTTYAMVRRGEIPARKIGDRWVIPKSRFHAWLDALPEATDAEVAAALAQIDASADRKETR
jgi:excisionase family DNA binding protein